MRKTKQRKSARAGERCWGDVIRGQQIIQSMRLFVICCAIVDPVIVVQKRIRCAPVQFIRFGKLTINKSTSSSSSSMEIERFGKVGGQIASVQISLERVFARIELA